MGQTLKLSQGQLATVDDVEFECVSKFKWSASRRENTYYAYHNEHTSRGLKRVYLHRFILGITDPKILVDHRDRNGLNCQRSNLRICTSSQNQANSKVSKNKIGEYKGVYWDGRRKKWEVKIMYKRRSRFLGYFDDPVQGAKMYDLMARKLFGEFAKTNFEA